MNNQQIIEQLKNALPDTEFRINGEACDLTVTAIGECFAGKSRVQRQQMVNGILQAAISRGDIHALSIRAYTPDEMS